MLMLFLFINILLSGQVCFKGCRYSSTKNKLKFVNNIKYSRKICDLKKYFQKLKYKKYLDLIINN